MSHSASAPSDTFGRRYFRTRKATQIAMLAFWISLPLFGLFQFDIAHVRLLILGHAWPPLTADMLPTEALQRGAAPRWDVIAPALAATVLPVLAFVVAFVLTARTFGRVHCGFTCAYGFLAETGEALFRWAKRPGPGRLGRLAMAWAIVIAAAPVVAWAILALFVSSPAVLNGLATIDPRIAVPFAVLTTIAVLMGGFVRLKFCRYVCGVGLVQSVAWMTNKKALEMGFNPTKTETRGSLRDCTGCHGCRDVCPIGFDPRQPKKYMMACFQCGECLKRCEDELYPLGKGPAIGFHLYETGYPLEKQAGAGSSSSPSIVSMAKGLS